ncbi:heavy-metal-associated domain-containing protein [Arthrobacter sp. MW3 TE3886]|uniref:heavy-metal-associated domain-containing protein n=1 Tax=Arthrobacter sp. MW3 TE3886 TaxID=3156254 RepID=UPI003516908E
MSDISSTPVTPAAETSGCSCCAPAPTSGLQIGRPQKDTGSIVVTDYEVEGMTCVGCAAGVTTQLKKVTGVTDVRVSLTPGKTSTVTVDSRSRLSLDDVREAVAKAGYSLHRS